MNFKIGQQIIYPNHGVGTIEQIEQKQIGATIIPCYELRLAFNNSIVLVPIKNAAEIGLRLLIELDECELLLFKLSEDFSEISSDWKIRFRDYTERMKKGDVHDIADALKKLTYLSRIKPLSFREQRLLEKARYLVISELAAVCDKSECNIEESVETALKVAFAKHPASAEPVKKSRVATVH
ncbi:MAG: hypothetical protein H7Z37_09060 [Pyrinomonadaceae bacterium]|nr:hypothetical protein [Pyrinomonadaceae bacterium]